MSNKLILVEGIPGSGKSTVALKIQSHLESTGKKVIMFQEGDLHPIDIAWCSVLTIEEYLKLQDDYPELKDLLKKWTRIEEDRVIVAYTKLGFYPDQNPLMTYLASKEVYQNKVSFESFKDLHIERWGKLSDQADEDVTYVFECVFFQNHIVELLGAHDMNAKDIKDYLLELITKVKDLNPKIIYLSQADVGTTINHVAKERLSEDKSKWKDWIDLVIEYVDEMLYSKNRNQSGYEAAIDFFETRKVIELSVLESMQVDKQIIDNSDFDLNRVMEEIIEEL